MSDEPSTVSDLPEGAAVAGVAVSMTEDVALWEETIEGAVRTEGTMRVKKGEGRREGE
jgi:hypothetical protein